MTANSDLYLRRLLVGPMANYAYFLGCQATRECWLVDPAWDLDAILGQLEADEMRLTGVLVTHYHPDHVGGDIFGHHIEGLPQLLERVSVPVHVHRIEREGIARTTGVSATDLIGHDGGEELEIGRIKVKLLHTPGHTPGSQCFLVEGNLVSGDTLFINGCGRVDLPGGNPEDMYRSLNEVLKRLPDATRVLPGHQYGPHETSTIGEEKRDNPNLQFDSVTSFLAAMGYAPRG